MPKSSKRRQGDDGRPQHETRKLSELVPFPLQSQLEGTTTPFEDGELVRDIKQHGLREPIQILPRNRAGLPENTILDGFRRKAALTACGEKEVVVKVRYDLANVDRQRIDEEFFRFNLLRRQLSLLAKARIAKGWIQSQRDQTSPQTGELRDRIGKLIGMSGRHLDRCLSILRTPMEIQAAFEREDLNFVLADRVSRLTEEEQRQIAQRIREGEPPRKVVTEFFPEQRPGHHVKPNDAFVSFMKALNRGYGDLLGRADRVAPKLIVDYEDNLRRARKLFGTLLDRRPPSPEDERYW